MDLRNEFTEKKKLVVTLRRTLTQQNSEKEAVYQQLKALRTSINSCSQKIKDLKKERNVLTQEVRKLKIERDKLNQVVKGQAESHRVAKMQRQDLGGQLRGDPVDLRKKIDKIDEQLETEVMAFSKEQALRKTQKEFKRQLKELKSLGIAWEEIRASSAGFSEKKQAAEASHRTVQEKAALSQQKHQAMEAAYDELKGLRESEKPLAEKYLDWKLQHVATKTELEKTQERVKELAKLFEEAQEDTFQDKVKQKTADVREKIRKGKKLSTEDILAFQALKD